MDVMPTHGWCIIIDISTSLNCLTYIYFGRLSFIMAISPG
jgi:hypothetical protein